MTPAEQRIIRMLDGRPGSCLVQLKGQSALRLQHATGQVLDRVYLRRHVVSRLCGRGELIEDRYFGGSPTVVRRWVRLRKEYIP